MKIIYTSMLSLLLSVAVNAQISCTPELFFTPEQFTPLGLATDGINFWVSGYSNDPLKATISIYDQSGNYIDSIYNVADPQNHISGLALQADTLWAVQERLPKLHKLNRFTGETYAAYDLPTLNPTDSNNFALAFDGTHLWNMEYFSPPSLFKIDPSNGLPLDTIPIDVNLVLSIEFINDKMIGISRSTDELYEIDLTTGETTYLIDWCLEDPYEIAFNPNGELFGISRTFNEQGNVYKVLGIDIPVSTDWINNNNVTTIEITPNPVAENLNVYCPEINQGQVMIMNALGQLCFNGQFNDHRFEKNINNFPAGIYYLHLEGNQNSATKKFIKME